MPLFRIDNCVGYFAHIPKCGGSSVEHYLRAVCESVVFIDNDFFSRTPDRLPVPPPRIPPPPPQRRC